MKLLLHLVLCFAFGVALIGLGYKLRDAEYRTPQWLLGNDCLRVAIAKSPVWSGGYLEIQDDTERWLCAGMLVK